MRFARAAFVALAATLAVAAAGGCGSGRSGEPVPGRLVRIAAASDLRYALEEIRVRLRQGPGDFDIQVSYGSSGSFFAQLSNGAPFDLFMSADVDYPRRLQARGLTIDESEFIYAIGRLAVWVPASSPIDVEKDGLEGLADPRIAHVAIANPEHAPYGRAAEAAMRTANVYNRVKQKIVLGENVSQALQFVQSGAAQAGVVALALAVAPAVQTSGKFWVVPEDMHPRLEQGGVILRNAGDPAAAQAVRAFLLGDEGRAILKRHGFALPGD